MFVIGLILLFIIKLRFPRCRPITATIERRYGRSILQLYRRTEKLRFKVQKIDEDLKFLNTCKSYHIIPNFIRFKVYTREFQFTRTYHSWQLKLLDYEIKAQTDKRCNILHDLSLHNSELRASVSSLDFSCLSSLLDSGVERKLVDVRLTHIRKLRNLGIDITKKVDPSKVIFNLSNRVLSKDEKDVLSLGLDFGLVPRKINFVKYFLSFEKLCCSLKNCALYGNETLDSIFNRISVIARDAYRISCRNKEGETPSNINNINVLSNLKQDNNIIIMRPDKGRGVVLMDRQDYKQKVYNILADATKFKHLDVDIASYIMKLEDRLNRILRSVKDSIGELAYNTLFASGSRPGYMYGLPKIHKIGNPLRPIISSIGTFNYNLAKFLVPVLKPLTVNEYSVGNCSRFVHELSSLNFGSNVVMASFDVTSLFTNIPLNETTDIILNNLSDDHVSKFGLDKSEFSKLLDMAACNNIFTFEGKLYNQIDGVAMGSSLGPVYADVFMGFNECIWLSECPVDFKPLFYRRYVDDTFLVFRDYSHIQSFLDYVNSKHPNITFTCDIETDSKLPFLDIQVTRQNGKFITSVFRKATFTGLGLNFLSFSPTLYKLNSVRTLINRAYNVCSDFNLFHEDIMFLLNYFTENSYPSFLFYKILRVFLNSKFEPRPIITTVKKDIKYIKLPYLGQTSYNIRKQLHLILKDAYPQIHFQFVFTNPFTVGSLLRERSSLPGELCSNVVYLFKCSQCGLRYLGSTSRWIKHRYLEHRGLSLRTGMPLSRPSHSAIREHSQVNNHPYTYQNFRILTTASNRLDLVISESILITKMKPELNNYQSAFKLSIL